MAFQFFIILPSPILRGHTSRLVSSCEVGAVFAVISGIMNMGNTLGSLAFEGLFTRTATTALPGAAFFMGTGLLLLFIPLY